ncbi:MAG: 4-hydroxy-tetrahydrodipicolinate reductase [Actinomycetota bacterium]
MRVGVVGAFGKMGREVCRAVASDSELGLVAAVDTHGVGEKIGRIIDHPQINIAISDELDMLADAEVEVAVDFTHPKVVMENVRWYVRHAIHAVVGTTGLDAGKFQSIRDLIEEEGSESNVFIAPNFAIGAVLMMHFAAQAAKFLPSAEIIELHHDRKADAPSGTALKTAEEIVKAREEVPPIAMGETLQGARGADVDGIRVHSIRLPGFVASQEVILGGPGQTLTIKHDTTDRTSFMPGVLLAVKSISNHQGLTIGLESLLDL